MSRLIYAPKALEDLQGIKNYINEQFDADRAKTGIKEIVLKIRQLERFPEEGVFLARLIQYPTDYRYLVIKPNYVFYRIEADAVKIIRILNEKQDFLQILFGIRSVSEDGEEYWSSVDEEW